MRTTHGLISFAKRTTFSSANEELFAGHSIITNRKMFVFMVLPFLYIPLLVSRSIPCRPVFASGRFISSAFAKLSFLVKGTQPFALW